MKDKNVSYLTQAAMIAAIYVVLTALFAPISFGEIQDPYCRNADSSSNLYSGSHPRIVCGMSDRQHPRGSSSAGYHLRKSRNSNRCGWNLCHEKSFPETGCSASDSGKYACSSFCSPICLRSSSPYPVFNGNCRNWRNYFLRSSWKYFSRCPEKIQSQDLPYIRYLKYLKTAIGNNRRLFF